MKTKIPPREGDLPVAELIRRAAAEILLDKKHGIDTSVHFKFTCENCGERCTLEEPNAIYEEGECHKCGHKTKIVVGGYSKWSRI